MFSAGYAVRAAHEAPPGRLLPLLSRHQPLCNDRLQWVVLRRSGWRWASYFNDSERARIEPYYVQNC